MKKLLKVLLYAILLLIIAFAGLLITAMVTNYDPDEITTIIDNKNTTILPDSLEFEIISWNIGYCGLDKSMDFFYDGGQQVRPDINNVKKSLSGVLSYLESNNKTEFIILQEVDKKSKRSHKINLFDSIKSILPSFEPCFGKNYDVFFVPTPPTQPYGKVLSGLMSLSKFKAAEASRYSFPGNYGFPKGLFMLDRCFLVQRFPLSNQKELLIINTHNSAYDDGTLRQGQMEYLKNFLQTEYKKGNYIVVGGDWNQCPPGIETSIEGYIFDKNDFSVIKENYLPSDWQWVYNNDIPTNRRVMKPWNKDSVPTTVIDYFLTSPNIEKIDIENIDLNFEFSDHQPVKAKFRLKKENAEPIESEQL